MAKTLNVKQGQSIYDICLQAYGTLNQLYKLIQDNNISNINAYIPPKTVITFDETLIQDAAITDNNTNTGVIYCTIEDTAEALQTDDGVNLANDDGVQILVD